MPTAKDLFVQELMKHKDPIVVDVGAFKGDFTLLAAMNHPECVVYAFEPNPEMRRYIAGRIAEDDHVLYRVSVEDYALWDKEGTGVLKVPKSGDLGLACLGQPSRFDNWYGISVFTTTLDSFFPATNLNDRIKIIKIDVEGAELMVLRGAEKLLTEHHPALLIEYAEMNTIQFRYDPIEIRKLLESYGYTHIEEVEPWDIWATK